MDLGLNRSERVWIRNGPGVGKTRLDKTTVSKYGFCESEQPDWAEVFFLWLSFLCEFQECRFINQFEFWSPAERSASRHTTCKHYWENFCSICTWPFTHLTCEQYSRSFIFVVTFPQILPSCEHTLMPSEVLLCMYTIPLTDMRASLKQLLLFRISFCWLASSTRRASPSFKQSLFPTDQSCFQDGLIPGRQATSPSSWNIEFSAPTTQGSRQNYN